MQLFLKTSDQKAQSNLFTKSYENAPPLSSSLPSRKEKRHRPLVKEYLDEGIFLYQHHRRAFFGNLIRQLKKAVNFFSKNTLDLFQRMNIILPTVENESQ